MSFLMGQTDIEMANNRSGDIDGIEDSFDLFDIKNSSIERLKRWRQAALVLNTSRRFCYILDLKKEEDKRQTLRKIRAHAQEIRAAHLLKNAAVPPINEEIEGLSSMFVNSFNRRLVNENLLHRLHETLCSAMAVVKDEELRIPRRIGSYPSMILCLHYANCWIKLVMDMSLNFSAGNWK